jgi:hypothetical protein
LRANDLVLGATHLRRIETAAANLRWYFFGSIKSPRHVNSFTAPALFVRRQIGARKWPAFFAD